MLSTATIAQLAAELHESEKSRVQVEHFSKRFPEMTIEDGYAISREWVKNKIAEGRIVKGHKIGLTSRAMQQSSQIDEPDYGTLLDDMFFEQGGDIPFKRFIAPRIEVELAFVLGKKLQGPNVTIFDVLAAEHDARIVMGGRPVKPDAVDLRWVSALLYKNGVIEESGVAAAVLNHPATGVAWLANKLAPWDECLEAGEVVLGGSFTRPTNAVPGDTFHADYGPLGAIAFRFV
jgi:2-oxo-hept-3-ene-1,7-dioate hydratase